MGNMWGIRDENAYPKFINNLIVGRRIFPVVARVVLLGNRSHGSGCKIVRPLTPFIYKSLPVPHVGMTLSVRTELMVDATPVGSWW